MMAFANYHDISEYGLIGDCRAAALVSRLGSIDWCCLPHFDSPSSFAAILDAERGGSFSISPAGSFSSAQHYLEDPNVLETRFETSSGQIRLIDLFSVTTEQKKRKQFWPDHEILRIVEGISGEVTVRMRYAPRPHYGKSPVALQDRGRFGIACSSDERLLLLQSSLSASQIRCVNNGSVAVAEFNVKAGESSLKEKVLDWLAGYKDSKPVRIGNAAENQLQLDVYGEVLGAICHFSPYIEQFDGETRDFILGLGEAVCELWHQPDDGIWEVRSGRVHHTHSKVLAWVALDRLITLARKYSWKAPIGKFDAIKRQLRERIETYGFNRIDQCSARAVRRKGRSKRSMNFGHAILWGFAATVVLTSLLSGARGLGLTRMDIPFMLGAMFTQNREKAKWIGFLIHLVNGWIFAFIYIEAFLASGILHWWFGAAIGLVHSMFVLLVGMRLLPGIHPRMADERSRAGSNTATRTARVHGSALRAWYAHYDDCRAPRLRCVVGTSVSMMRARRGSADCRQPRLA